MSKDFKLGVLVVHGIGMQPPLDTLVRWTDKLIHVINKAHPDDSPVASVRNAGIGHNSGDGRAEVELDLNRSQGEKSERWLFTEGWWGDAFPTPTYRELFSWSLRAVPWIIACYLVPFGPVIPDKEVAEVLDTGRWNPRALTHRVATFLLLPVVILILGIVLVLGILPIPQVRSFVMAAQSKLTLTVGDSLAFVESPVRAALIRARIFDALESLKTRCENTIVIAHSQGGAVCVDALAGIALTKKRGQQALVPVPDTLLTFGAGTNPLVNLQGDYPRLFSYIVWIDVLAMYIAFGLLGILVRDVYLQELSAGDAMIAAGIALVSLLAGVLAAMLVGICIIAIWAKLKKDPMDFTDRIESLNPWYTFSSMFLGAAAGTIYSAMRFDTLTLPIILVATATVALLYSSSDTIPRVLTRRVQAPIPVRHWIDIYASSDPVPNGPTRVRVCDDEEKSEEAAIDARHQNFSFETVEIHNEGSILADHTTYWENLEGFVLRVVHACAETAGSPWQRDLPTATTAGNRRARWRVNHLKLVRWFLALGSLVALALLWGRFQDSPPVFPRLPEWTRPLDLVILVLAAWAVASRLLRLPWRRWVRSEEEQAIVGKPPQRTPWRPFVEMGVVLGLIFFLAAAASLGDASLLQRPAIESTGLMLLFIAAGIGIELAARWLLRAPKN